MYADREEAGRDLAARLSHLKDEAPVVLALPRGGVPVGFEIARALKAPLDLVLVRKIGAPFQPELAIGAVADGARPEVIVNPQFVGTDLVASRHFQDEATRQAEEIERRRALYFHDRPRAPVEGRTAILVDDGIATGSTMRVAILATRRALPRRLVLAVPVAADDSLRDLADLVDDVVCPLVPHDLAAIGYYYRDFQQLEDDEVIELLARNAKTLANERAE